MNKFLFHVVFWSCLFFVGPKLSFGQRVDESEKKAAYILNFIKHITWEHDDEINNFRIAVYGDTMIYRALKESTSNKLIRDKSISVNYITNQLNLSNFQIIVVGTENNSVLPEIYKKFSNNRLILTSEANIIYSMINFRSQDNKLQFDLNETNITKNHLKASEYLRGISISDVDILRSKVLETDKKVELAKEAIANQEKIIEQQKKEIKKKIEELHIAEINLMSLIKDGDSLRSDVQRQKENLLKLQSEVIQKEKDLKEKELQLVNMLKEQNQRQEINEKQKNEINIQNKTIQENKKFLQSLKDEVKAQKETILKRETLVQRQRNTIFIVVSIMFFIILIAFFIYRSNRIKHLANIELEDKNKKILRQASELELKTDKLSKAILELKMTQNHLINSEKMAALGGMVAGVAHEINTPVGIGVTAMSHLQSKYNEFMNLLEKGDIKKSDLIKFLEVVNETTQITEHNLERAATLVQNFKQVSVDQSSEDMRYIFIEKYIRDIITNLTHEFKHTKIDIKVNCDEDFEINTYPGAISQIITNLLMNTKTHAFEKGQKGEVNITIEKEENQYRILFSDNGKGIPKENINKIFEPFFTTKRNEGGSGLGLSIVHNIVTNQLKGDIQVESEKEKGTRFIINIPINII